MDNCHVFNAASLIGKKWTFALVEEIALNERTGFNAIFKKMRRISPKVLSKRLDDLEKTGILEKNTSIANNSRRTSYRLTEKGAELYSIIRLMKSWNTKHSEMEIECESMECVKCPLY